MPGGDPKDRESCGGNNKDSSHKTWCLHALKDEIRCSNFYLTHPTPQLLVSDQWGYPSLYVGWRVLVAVFHLAWIIYVWTEDATRADRRTGVWLVYLTNWTYLVLTCNTLLLALVVVYVRCTGRDLSDGESPWYVKASWLVYTIASVGSLMVTLLYFTLLFHGHLSPVSGETHLGNSVYVILDLCVTAMPVRLFHVIYPMVYAIVYCVFTVIYWAAGGVTSSGVTYIYKPLDWSKAEVAAPLVIGAGFVGVPLVHLVLWSLHMLRLALHRYCCGGGSKRERGEGMDAHRHRHGHAGHSKNGEKGDNHSKPSSVNVVSSSVNVVSPV